MFLENKYTKWYMNIIQNARQSNRKKGIADYFESHHVIPKALGGDNSKNNLCLLTAKEHYICHLLLIKMTTGTSRHKMLHSFMLMKGHNGNQPRYINSSMYERIKVEYAQYRSIIRKGQPMSVQQKLQISKTLKGHAVSMDTRNKISEKAKARIRKPFTEEYKHKMSLIMKEKHRWK